MCCIVDSFLSDLFTLVRQLIVWITASFTSTTSLEGEGVGVGRDYKMMSKKGLLKFVKYTLIFSNAFGFILSIFLGLFGIAYPDKHFPLSYKGREMALCSLFCMLFTTIGYCGAQNHRRILLIIYGATNVIIVIIVVILWFLFKENSILGNKEISNMFITTLAITIAVMFLFSFILAFHIQTFKDNKQDSIVSQSHQLLQQTTAFLQQQQQHQNQHQHQHQHQQQQQQQHQHHQQQHQHQPSSSSIQHQTLPRHQHLKQQQQHPGQLEMDTLHQHHHQPAHQHLGHLGAGHHGAQLGNHLQLGGGVSPHQLPPPPPPLKHLHQAGKSAGLLQLASQGPGAHQMLSPPQVPAGQQQLGLMRNQSSPLPGAQLTYQPISGHRPSSGKGSSSQQQHYQQQQAKIQGQQQQQQPTNSTQMIQPPPPSPPSIRHHSVRADHHHQRHQPPPPPSLGAGGSGSGAGAGGTGGGARLPSCPVQYCTFQCDRTV